MPSRLISHLRPPRPTTTSARAASSHIVVVLVLLLVSTVLAAVPARAAPEGSPPPEPIRDEEPEELVAELTTTTGGQVRLATEPGGRVSFAGAPADHPLAAGDPSDKQGSARRFIDRFSPVFGVTEAGELEQRNVVEAADGGLTVRYAQRLDGIPVIGGDIAVRVDGGGRVLATTGHALPDDRRPTTRPDVAADAARRSALDITATARSVDATTLTSTAPELHLWDPSIFDPGSTDPATLVWQSTVRNERGDVSELVLVDALTGGITFHADQVERAQQRKICHAVVDWSCAHPARVEGGPPTGHAETDNLYDYAGDTYNFYNSRFGRDGIDGHGMDSVMFVGDYEANAHWDPFTEVTVYGVGYVTDDVVGHELTHGITQFTSNLAYFGQSGAINESMSDVFGEFVDLTNGRGNDVPNVRWLSGEEIPTGAVRSLSDPPSHGQPDRMRSPEYDNEGNAFDPHGGSGVGNKTAFLITDGGSFNGQTVNGIGIDKAARVFYETQVHLLASGSNYADLGNGLQQACLQLTGTHGITAGDCDQVRKATLATELNLTPANPAVGLGPAPVCGAGEYAHDVFVDDMEDPHSRRWYLGHPSAPVDVRPNWGYEAGLATSGNRALTSGDPGVISMLEAGMVNATHLPAGEPAFLRFNHAIAAYEDAGIVNGGVVEYRVDGIGEWIDAGPLLTTNGYDKTLNVYPPLGVQGRRGFGGQSNGFVSTRADFSSLAGHDVQVRFRYAVTSNGLDPGWTIDDVRIYSCRGATSVPDAPSSIEAVAGIGQAVVSWDPPTSNGGTPITGYTVTAAPGGASVSVGAARSAIVPGLTNGTGYSFTVTATNQTGTGPASLVSNEVTPTAQGGSLFHPLPPFRVLDSRNATGLSGRWGPGQTRDLSLLGVGGVPASNVSAVVVNVTVTDATAPSHLTLFPAGTAQPNASNLNFDGGQTIANHVTVKVGAGGKVSIFNNAGHVAIVADVVGYEDGGSGGGAAFAGIQPFRRVDTRDGTGGLSWPWFPGQDEAITIAGTGGPSGVPADAAAVVMNLTAVNGTSASHLTAYPDGQPLPVSSNVNFPAASVVPNLVTVKLGAGGRIRIRNQAGFVHVLVDIVGYYANRPGAGRFVPLDPSRIVDTREPNGLQPRRFSPGFGGETRDIVAAGVGGVPRAGASSVVLNVTGIGAMRDTHVSCWSSGEGRPNVSNLNLVAGGTASNQVIVKLGRTGQIRCLDNMGEIDLVVDVVGYFT